MNAIVRFARSRDILCQGRGSAANSAVCYVLGITSIDPNDLLFEHFVSEERREPPDIDVDFEHERREIVMQWVFDTYGRDHAALCSTVIRYRAKGALRDAGKALSLPEDLIKLLSSQVWGWSRKGIEPKHAEELNLNLGDRRLRLAIANGYERDFAEKTFKQLEGFGSYGFPESHAASFALIAYASSWLKCHHPDVFCAALLNAQPMGFYAPAQIVRDARDHGGVDVRPVCVNASRFDCTLEPTEEGDRFAVRLGLRIFPLPHGRGDELNHGSPGLDPRSLPPKGLEVRDVHFPDLHIDTIKMKTREFR